MDEVEISVVREASTIAAELNRRCRPYLICTDWDGRLMLMRKNCKMSTHGMRATKIVQTNREKNCGIVLFLSFPIIYRNKSVRARLDQSLRASSTIYLLGIVDLAEARLLRHVLALSGFGSSRRATSLCGVFGLKKQYISIMFLSRYEYDIQQLTSSSASSSPASSSSSSRSLPSTSSSSASTSGSSSSTSSAGSGSVLRFLVLGAVHVVVRKMFLMPCDRARDLRAAASASSSSSSTSSSASSSSSSSLAAPASSPSEMYLYKQNTSVIVVRHMRRARSHWDVRCDGRGPIARE